MFLDDKFGNIVSIIGRRSILPENLLSEKYAELTAHLKVNLHDLYESLFKMEQEALDALQKGEKNIGDIIRRFYSRIDEIQNKINDMAVDAKHELEKHALTIQGEWVHMLSQYTQNIDSIFTTMNQMFQQLAQRLMQSFLEAAMKVVPNVTAIIESLKQEGLLSFLHQ